MKKILPFAIAALGWLVAPPAQAWTYNNGDVLLIFRNAANATYDVEYDIGNVSQFLGHTNGYTTTVTGWNPNDVLGALGGQNGPNLTGLSVALLAATSFTNASPTAYLSGIEPNYYAYSVNAANWTADYYNNISAIGNKPVTSDVPAADTNAYAINPNGKYKASAYEYILSEGGQNYNLIPQLGGNVPFTVEQTIPGSLDFWQVQPLESGGVSPADKFVGTFSININGVLTFTAGPSPASLSVTQAGQVTSVNLATTVGINYQLVGASQLGGSTAWTPVGSPLSGDGHTHSLNDTNTATARFYRVTAQ